MAAVTPRPRMVLVEVFADRAAGHYGDNLVRLCRAANRSGYDVTAVCVEGVHPQIRQALDGVEVTWRTGPIGVMARLLLQLSRWLRPVHSAAVRLRPRGNIAPRVRYVAKSLTEAASLRTARTEAGTTVLLSASQALTASTTALSGVSHIRLVHDLGVTEGRVLGGTETLLRRSARRATLVCTTESVRQGLLARHQWLRAVTQPFTVDDPTMYIEEAERSPARQALGITDDEFAVCMVGGWWDYKDIGLVERALRRMTRPLTLILVGNPMRPAELEPAVAATGGRLVVLQGAVTESELRQVYAASDCALVTRVPGFDREASTIYDATRYGVPVVVTDHDASMHDRLAQEPSIILVKADDDEALAAALADVADNPPPRPDRDTTARLGLRTGEAKISFFRELSENMQVPVEDRPGTASRS